MLKPGSRSGSVLRTAVFGCVPTTNDDATRAHLNDLCEVLTQVLGIVIQPHRAPSPAALVSAYTAGRVQLVWSSPALFITEAALSDAVPLVQCVRAGRASYVGCLFVPESSPILEPGDLAGARVAWVAETSAAGYLFPRVTLAERGTPASTLFSEEVFLGSYGAVLDSVRAGETDVGATFAVFESGRLRQAAWASVDAEDHPYRVILRTSLIPSDMIVASPELIDQVPADLVEQLEALHERPGAAEAMRQILGADAFRRVDPEHLERARELVEEMQRALVVG